VHAIVNRLLTLLLLALLLNPVRAAEPRVALVLGGGGARGAAHIGVLEVLERERVRVDCIAGTSMGALVAGAYASGMTPAQMRVALQTADWNDMFLDNAAYSELDFRSHQLARHYFPGAEFGLGPKGELRGKPGVITGQKMKLFFNRLLGAEQGEPQIERLRLPLAIIATDIGSGERVVFRDGSLPLAMRASMSVPGLLAPLDYRGRKLVDGGLVDNLPVAEARALCNAGTVIAVDVGSPLQPAEQVGSLLSITGQMIGILTQQNVDQSLRLLRSGQDILIRPDLNGFTAADFARNGEIADRGLAAAEAALPRLQPLGVDAAQHARWRTGLVAPATQRPALDEIEIAGLKRVNPAAVQRHLRVAPGDFPDVEHIEADVQRVFGDGYYQSVDYSVINGRDKRILRITPIEKPWGPDYVRFGLRLDSVIGKQSSFSLRGALHRTWLNPMGGELLYEGEIGQTSAAAVSWYQPLSANQRFFIEPRASYQRTQQAYYQNDWRIADYQVRRGELSAALGTSFGSTGHARLGWVGRQYEYELETGLPLAPTGGIWSNGLDARIDIDQFDRLYFPERGWSFNSHYYKAYTDDYARLSVDLKSAHSLHDIVLSTQLQHVRSLHGRLPYYDAASLGGFRKLSGTLNQQMLGDEASFASLDLARIIGRMPLGLRGDMRLGITQEVGRMRGALSETGRTDWQYANAIYVGGETPFGALYLGWGHLRHGPSHWYLFLGTP
jgi:NTE family protein